MIGLSRTMLLVPQPRPSWIGLLVSVNAVSRRLLGLGHARRW
jgi:hypothetical protein